MKQKYSQDLEGFAQHLIEEKGLEGLDADILHEVRLDIVDKAEDAINAALIEHMPETQLAQFEQLLDTGADEAMQAFCATHIQNIEEVVAGALMKFRSIYLAA